MNPILLIVTAAFSVLSSLAATDAPIPRPPWKLELLASSPEIRHPSVVCAAPDGRILVAEDPMDISAPANASQGRIIAFHPDGRRTIFATNLFAVFGLQYLEGKVYVLHNPRFTVFKDSGEVGTNPEDLIESTNPNPWALDWNDHVPANFKLAMDGYFYMAVGDKGIYNAKTKDGRTINLHGGGILRIKPDGTGAEIFSTGVRNILDVAITSEDEIFTYDNTDEHDWMGRLTHMVDGGFYGYPHHFVPRRPYTLWMMHDFGGGAATGTFANTEDALPPEYHDNLFLADFGKRQIIRVVLERDGATFKVARHEELFSDMPDSFRPVGIAPSHDGKSILICDWQHRDTKENVEVGRLWKLTWTGQTFSQPKPSWYIPAAQGQTFEATTQQLSDALAHASRNVRLTAQRQLTKSYSSVSLLKDAPREAHWHKLWAQARFSTPSLRQLTLPDDPSQKRQELRVFSTLYRSVEPLAIAAGQTYDLTPGYNPSMFAQPLAIRALKDPDASVRFLAATALGHLKTILPRPIPELLAAVPERDPVTRFAIETALNRLGRQNPVAWKIIANSLSNENADVRQSIYHSLRATYDTNLVAVLEAVVRLSTAPLTARESAVSLVAQIARKLPEWKGEWWAYHPALAPAPKKTESWQATESILATLRKVLADEPQLRLTTIRALTENHETSLAPDLRDLYPKDDHPEVRKEILHALATFHDTNSAQLVLAALQSSNPQLAKEALTLARHSKSKEVLTNIASLISNTENSDLRLEAITTSAHLRNGYSLPAVTAAATNSFDPRIRSAAIAALGKIGGPVAAKTLLSLFDTPEPDLHL